MLRRRGHSHALPRRTPTQVHHNCSRPGSGATTHRASDTASILMVGEWTIDSNFRTGEFATVRFIAGSSDDALALMFERKDKDTTVHYW
jgi:hypothetical protein